MKKFGCLMLALSVSLFTFGCTGDAKKPGDDKTKPGATADTKDKAPEKGPEAPKAP